ncbi:hypothetical protein [Liquorilactobacillus mali]|uniref:hypothetical protein n=1 Tax=Liquorilactobacillus mali TaxID=1618 RepID=UPI0002491FFE|nr:hypothetical protein [Liquorilactobacillus mali]EJF01322.1 hypothetical protein LMA_01489 [Liquorilactobacillus mali KCTC 3596 = DSM 20444]MDC7952713.1 hypothetical protein [Liquorilactobacillus mali]MDV7758057.1 hypothetical protein [Liquorilactobacillus mali]QFQ74602.1 hypothetical protein LM596_05495 [Liquorilactobacillus mali]
MRLIGKSGNSLVHDRNHLIDLLSEDIKSHGDFTCWCTFKIIDGIKIYTSYMKINNYRSEGKNLLKYHKSGEYFETIQATDLLKILKKRNKVG